MIMLWKRPFPTSRVMVERNGCQPGQLGWHDPGRESRGVVTGGCGLGVVVGEALTFGEGCDSGAVDPWGKGQPWGAPKQKDRVGVAGSPGRDDPWAVALREGVTLRG